VDLQSVDAYKRRRLEEAANGQDTRGRRRSYGDPGKDVDWEMDAEVDAGYDDE
jgi:hypothetical protein